MSIKSISDKTVLPIGFILAVIGVAYPMLDKAGEGRAAVQIEQVRLKADVAALEVRVVAAETRLNKADERWDSIKDDLAAIKTQLGIVESKVK